MNINILRYSLFGIAGGQEVDRNFSKKQNVLQKALFLTAKYTESIVTIDSCMEKFE